MVILSALAFVSTLPHHAGGKRCEMPLSFDRQQLSPKRLVAIVSAILALYSVARVGVLFFEALAIVREERGQDEELLALCQRGDARASPKMRDACLKARADRASPLIAKAIVYAVSTAFKDFSDTVGSPFKFGVVLLFIISSVILPITPWARALFGTSTNNGLENGMGIPPSHFIVMAPPQNNGRRGGGGWRRRLGRHVPMLRTKPTIEEVDDEAFDCMEPGSAQPNVGWQNIPFNGGEPNLPAGTFHAHAD